MMDYAYCMHLEVPCSHPCPRAASVAIQVFLQHTSAHWYVRNRQIEEDFGISFFTYIRALTANFDSKLADEGNPLAQQLGKHFCQPKADLSHPTSNRGPMLSRLSKADPNKAAKSTK
jgi:hypothetical protein